MEQAPEYNPIEKSQEFLQDREMIFQDDHIRIYHPVPPAIPQTEGMHLTVDLGRDLDHEDIANTPDLLRSAYYALAVAKIEAEGKYTEDFWANIQMNSHPGTEKGVNVFGKNPQSLKGWGKPMQIQKPEERTDQSLLPDQKKLLSRTAGLYLPKWENLAPSITVFPEGVKETSPDDPVFQAEADKWINRPDPWQEQLIWMNEKFSLVLVKNPHLDGLHLVCHARWDYWSRQTEAGINKAWQTPIPGEKPTFIQGFVESNAILLGAQSLLNDFYNPEIHYSGNWGFKPLDPVSENIGGRTVQEGYLSDEDLLHARKREKLAAEKRWQSNDVDWHAHGHLYATRSADQYVELPSRPAKEVPQEWAQTKPLNPEEEAKVSQIIRDNLTNWLETNTQGVKIG